MEKSKLFCLYKPKVNPVNIAPILEGLDVKIEYVDFSQGLEPAIRQTAKLLDREARADALIEAYNKNMAVYNLPIYIDSSVIEFPDILRQWAVALVR